MKDHEWTDMEPAPTTKLRSRFEKRAWLPLMRKLSAKPTEGEKTKPQGISPSVTAKPCHLPPQREAFGSLYLRRPRGLVPEGVSRRGPTGGASAPPPSSEGGFRFALSATARRPSARRRLPPRTHWRRFGSAPIFRGRLSDRFICDGPKA